ncbi:uncharacterized protein L969DRAFT_16892 [Mixia osmundae IAM 14324]|uniref:Uncharacterized protein n=1 Tax=Mixia osmundae (strain CBS 9802 / IAM 14324 / JCM 22182 / KY 12970) TaxID=764103 RepID=G7E8X1_MIXOS|nr:uncharacterized protein L969DRAFT_16892 [Mixia osmundae IAM 14324]KEI40224.1 hypothetical protein L969DRAFT_16892 [Mixia osmundae IAM 14324]GAA99589.1 hypothetical protein E5Q_06290 [Mixia osmundae IAM 14324]
MSLNSSELNPSQGVDIPKGLMNPTDSSVYGDKVKDNDTTQSAVDYQAMAERANDESANNIGAAKIAPLNANDEAEEASTTGVMGDSVSSTIDSVIDSVKKTIS